MAKVIVKENVDLMSLIKSEHMWRTILLNCNCHTFDEVIEQIIKAIGCSEFTASQMANVAHQFGSVEVWKGEKSECEKVAYVLEEIGLFVDVKQ